MRPCPHFGPVTTISIGCTGERCDERFDRSERLHVESTAELAMLNGSGLCHQPFELHRIEAGFGFVAHRA